MTHDDRPPVARANVVPSGCVLGTSLLILVVAVAGYFGYRYFAGALEVPKELAPYTSADSVRALIGSGAPAPPAGTRLDPQWLALYLDGLDATGAALLDARDAIDSVYRARRARGDTNVAKLLTSPALLHAIGTISPSTKRSLVAYLNGRHRSLEEYRWAKLRTIAATDITLESADSALRALVGRYFAVKRATVSFGGESVQRWFDSIDSLRATGTITGEERALAQGARRRILEKGLGSLYGFDTDFDE